MTSNKGVVTSPNGKLYDYVEIYNGNDKEVNLKDYGLSDEASVKWVFPDTVVPAKGYVLVFLGGIREKGLITNFKLKSSGGETLTFFKPNWRIKIRQYLSFIKVNGASAHADTPSKKYLNKNRLSVD
jgi:hypothetical protein